MSKNYLPIFAAIFLLPAIAHADMVWPALFLEQSILTWWVILIGLAIEWPFFKLATRRSWRQSALLTFLANLASTLVGLILIPAAGLGWEFFPGQFVNHWLRFGTFNVLGWAATFILAVAINSLIEGLVTRRVKVPLKRSFPWLALANALSVGLAFLELSFR